MVLLARRLSQPARAPNRRGREGVQGVALAKRPESVWVLVGFFVSAAAAPRSGALFGPAAHFGRAAPCVVRMEALRANGQARRDGKAPPNSRHRPRPQALPLGGDGEIDKCVARLRRRSHLPPLVDRPGRGPNPRGPRRPGVDDVGDSGGSGEAGRRRGPAARAGPRPHPAALPQSVGGKGSLALALRGPRAQAPPRARPARRAPLPRVFTSAPRQGLAKIAFRRCGFED
mmetsp:Transcript_9756/g.34316  ORF Transcript_9756/g.34316 Transcript_9756/m.34316 type:complete len:230 (+) Transcript_9756:171-860(+)